MPRERGGAGRAVGGPQERREHWPSGAAFWRDLQEREEGTGASGRPAGVERTSRGIDWRAGEARGGRGTRRQRSGALPGTPERDFGRHPRLSRVRAHPLASGNCRGMGKSWGVPWMLGRLRGEREVRRRCGKEENSFGLMEEAQTWFLVKMQKVFDASLGK